MQTFTSKKQSLPKWAQIVRYISTTYQDGVFSFVYQIDDEDAFTITLSHNIRPTLSQTATEQIGFNIGMCYLMDIAEIVLTQKIWIYQRLPESAIDYWMHLYEELVVEKCYALQIPISTKEVVWETGDTIAAAGLLTIDGKRDHGALCLTGGKESLAVLKTLEDKKPLLLFFLNLERNVHRRRVYETVKEQHLAVHTISNREDILGPLKEKYLGLKSGVDMIHLTFNTMLYADICEYVLIGNEYSSNYPNDIYEGSIVNHQFVKTIQFAKNLNKYIHQHVTNDFTYYSPFFGLYEYKIAELFFKDDRYLDVWTSCNQATTEVNFCSECHKCAFTYLLARTKRPEAYLRQFFSADMLQNVPLFKPLMDFVGVKPLDCVGDKSEVWVALEYLLDHKVEGAVIEYYSRHIRPSIVDELPEYKRQINSIQRVPVDFPEDVQHIFYKELGLSVA